MGGESFRLIVVVGARPNFIKVAPLMPRLLAAGIDARIAHTGQHYDTKMSDVFFADLGIPEPAWHLGVGSGTHAVQTGVAMMRIEELLAAERPDALMVIGDVNSTLAGALAASKLGIPVVHLEAGLRSGDMSMPEEVNRLVTDQLSAVLLAPTADAVEHLAAEGIEGPRVHHVGNIMAEAVLSHQDAARRRHAAERLGVEDGPYVVATVHRPENTENQDRFSAIADALRECGPTVVVPCHPRSLPAFESLLGSSSRVELIEPMGYLDMLSLLQGASAVVTDSGGLQEEACMLGVPCVTVRRNTERTVTVELGANRLADPGDPAAVAAAIADALASARSWQRPALWDEGVSSRVTEVIAAGVTPLRGCG